MESEMEALHRNQGGASKGRAERRWRTRARLDGRLCPQRKSVTNFEISTRSRCKHRSEPPRTHLPHRSALASPTRTSSAVRSLPLGYNAARVEDVRRRSCCVQRRAHTKVADEDRGGACSCIHMTNLMQLRAADDGAEPILLSSHSFQGSLPNQQPRRGLV